jgi:hypothetical protein
LDESGQGEMPFKAEGFFDFVPVHDCETHRVGATKTRIAIPGQDLSGLYPDAFTEPDS